MIQAGLPCEMNSKLCCPLLWHTLPWAGDPTATWVCPLLVSCWYNGPSSSSHPPIYRPTCLASRRSRRVILLRQYHSLPWVRSISSGEKVCNILAPNLFSFLLSQALRIQGFRQGKNNLLESGSLLLKNFTSCSDRFHVILWQ